MGGFTETVGITVYLRLAVFGFRDGWHHSLSKCLNCRRQFSVPEMGGFTETVGITVYLPLAVFGFRDGWHHSLSKCLNCRRQFSVPEMVASLRQLASLSIKVS